MKKLLFGAMATIALSFVSCESDDAPNNLANEALRVSKITETLTFGEENQTQVTQFHYDQNNQILESISTPNTTTTFEYAANDVVAAHRESVSGETSTDTFTYNNGVLVSISNDGEYSETTDFAYESGVLAGSQFRYMSSGEWIEQEQRQFEFVNSNKVSETIQSVYMDGYFEYTFDTKNSPFRFLGDSSLRLYFSFENIDAKNFNNPLTRSDFDGASPETPSGYGITYEMQYNAQGYPTQIVKKTTDGVVICTTLIEYL